jgi:endogenous inhibitor of DNA gyrase (YacG/DUF329 family)
MKCPGQDMQYWTDNAIFEVDCPKCGKPVEFYKDDTSRKCPHCSNRFVNPKMDFGCAAYCPFAEQCIGTLPEEFKGVQDSLLKYKVAVEVKRYFHTDFKAISRATKIARFAENIGKAEGGNLAVILCCAYLEGVEKTEAETILKKLSTNDAITDEVLSVLEQLKSNIQPDTSEAQIVHDAVLLFTDGKSKNQFFTKTAQEMQTETA